MLVDEMMSIISNCDLKVKAYQFIKGKEVMNKVNTSKATGLTCVLEQIAPLIT